VLSVVLIARNQESTIGPLIGSVMRELPTQAAHEVILVDSASSDRTVEIALDWPIGVVALPSADWLCAAAGRHAGYAASQGERILFLDGDMELCSGWLARALRALDADPAIAAVTGRIIDSESGVARLPADRLNGRLAGGEPAWEVPHSSGAAVYRRSALVRVGCFNPYIRSDEEPELALRLRESGYRIVTLDVPAVIHHEPVPGGGVAALLARRRRGLFIGHGQLMRARAGRPGFARLVRERNYAVAPLAAVAASAGTTSVSLRTRRARWLLVWLLTVVGVLGADAIRRRSGRATALAVLNRLLFAEGLLRGWGHELGDPGEHPVNLAAQWVRRPGSAQIRRAS
jgi:glycosyltransferase involved in cell wall biosynthesis